MTEKPKPMILKVVEIHACVEGDEGTDYLIADKEASEAAIMMGTQGVYCQVADRLTADMFVTCVNAFTKRGITDQEGVIKKIIEIAEQISELRKRADGVRGFVDYPYHKALNAAVSGANKILSLLSQMEERD